MSSFPHKEIGACRVTDDPLYNMRNRAAQCRRLAASTLDHEMKRHLRGWANEIEADIRRLEDRLRRED